MKEVVVKYSRRFQPRLNRVHCLWLYVIIHSLALTQQEALLITSCRGIILFKIHTLYQAWWNGQRFYDCVASGRAFQKMIHQRQNLTFDMCEDAPNCWHTHSLISSFPPQEKRKVHVHETEGAWWQVSGYFPSSAIKAEALKGFNKLFMHTRW